MPCFRGIELSIVAASDHRALPEFPHPDGSSARFGGAKAASHSSAVFLSPRPRKQADVVLCDDAQPHADPKISVYIPSAPETDFYFRYGVSQPPAGHHRYLFFKVAINGRDVVSWGVDLSETTAGAAHQALFAPSARYQYNDNGVLMTEYGIESRCFRFVSCGGGAASVADDGGLLEVQVFRAKARSRRAPQPDQYRGGGRYGIALISNGLLEDPHTASYYDYHLVDARDSPYASFRFHYRSWENLRSLQLAPDDRPGVLGGSPCQASPLKSAARRLRASRPTLSVSRESYAGVDETDGARPQPRETQEFTGFDFPLDPEEKRHTWAAACFQYDRGPPRASAKCLPSPSLAVSVSQEGVGLADKERPLPELPVTHEQSAAGPESPVACGLEDAVCAEAEAFLVQRARGLSSVSKSSAASKISIAASLQAYADGEEGLLVDTMELGSATKLEALFHGKPSSQRAPDGFVNKSGPPLPSDDMFRCEGSGASPGSCAAAGSSSPSPPKTRPRYEMLFVAPFTDSLRKRGAASVPPHTPDQQSFRRASHDVSPQSRGSPKPRRRHGGSLDSAPRLLLGRRLSAGDKGR